jgi:hypothetical protein
LDLRATRGGPSKNDPKVARIRPAQRAFASTFLGIFGDFEAFAAEGLLDFWNTDRKTKSPKVSKPTPSRNADGAPLSWLN